MIGEAIRAELRRPLEGDRRWVHETRPATWSKAGYFVHRRHPEHIAAVLAEKARQRVLVDLAAFRALRNREICLGLTVLELTEVSDPYDGFHDPDDFPQVWS